MESVKISKLESLVSSIRHAAKLERERQSFSNTVRFMTSYDYCAKMYFIANKIENAINGK